MIRDRKIMGGSYAGGVEWQQRRRIHGTGKGGEGWGMGGRRRAVQREEEERRKRLRKIRDIHRSDTGEGWGVWEGQREIQMEEEGRGKRLRRFRDVQQRQQNGRVSGMGWRELVKGRGRARVDREQGVVHVGRGDGGRGGTRGRKVRGSQRIGHKGIGDRGRWVRAPIHGGGAAERVHTIVQGRRYGGKPGDGEQHGGEDRVAVKPEIMGWSRTAVRRSSEMRRISHSGELGSEGSSGGK